jgi:hypothetical protein
MLFFIFNGKLTGFVIIKAKQEVLCLLKTIAHVWTWKMTEDELSAFFWLHHASLVGV